MKTDQFDETLRKKIESIEPIFHEADWQRFTAFAGTQPIPFWGKATLYAVGTTAFIGLIIYNINQYYAQKSLLQKVHTLAQQIDNLKHQQPAAPQRDTIYITRYLAMPVGVDAPQKTLRNKLQDETLQLTTGKTTPSLNYAQTESPSSIDNTTTAYKSGAEPKFASGLLANKRHIQPTFGARSSDTPQRTNTSGSAINGVGGAEPVGGNEPTNHQLAATPPVVGNLHIEPLTIIGIDSGNRMKVAEPKIYTQTAYYEAPKPPKTPFVWPQFTARAGIGSGVAAGYFVPSFTTELFIGKQVSVSSGLKIGYFSPEKYFTDEQFFKKKQLDFRKMHAPKAPPAQEILNISERVQLVQIPIRLNYYQPLKRGFWLTGAVGTDVDIYGSKRVKFDLRANRSEFEQIINIDKFPVLPLNNFVFSAGLEKRLGRVGLQVNAYGMVQTRRPPYKKSGNNFGGEFKLLYQF